MLIIGFLLLAAAAAVGIDVAAENDVAIDVETFGQVVSTTLGGVFVAGAVTGLAGALAVMSIRDGTHRARLRRADMRRVQEERDRLVAAAGDGSTDGETIDLRHHDDVRDHPRASTRDQEHITTF